MKPKGDPYGLHRVIDPPQSFPQSANRLDASLPTHANEILISVERLNLDSASFRQLREKSHDDPHLIARDILQIVHARGKMHNPVTHSGGTLLGTIQEVGSQVTGKGFQTGERVATLVSLSLTPLHLDRIESIDLTKDQVRVKGYAILFESGILHRIPPDFSDEMALAIFDVCGAPALVATLARVGETVIILGAGKAGILVAAESRKKIGKSGKIFMFDHDDEALNEATQISVIDKVAKIDLTHPQETRERASHLTEGRMADLVVNCVNVSGTEISSILAAKRSGTVLFFNMSTNFQAAVLGAEGIGHETRLIMGNGYYPGHADLALNLVRENFDLRQWFEKKFK